jgi:hypothetical protein
MNSLLIHGCYDSATLNSLKELGVKKLAFDLRGRSLNMIPYRQLVSLLRNLSTEQIFLTFENDKIETIHSYLNLLKNEPFSFTLIFRDNRPAEFYQKVDAPYYWMFQPESDWKSILSESRAKGVILPIKYQTHYQRLPKLWDLIDEKNLDVYLHADNFEQSLFMNLGQEINISLDLTPEVETSYRNIDQEKLKKMKIWRRSNENFTRQ